jgi:hypothetical protein
MIGRGIEEHARRGREERERDARESFAAMMSDPGFDAIGYAAEQVARLGAAMADLLESGHPVEQAEAWARASLDAFHGESNRLAEAARSSSSRVQ